MKRTHLLPGRPGAGRIFLAALWTALTTALLSALLPAGLPQSTAIGSAFNPATTTVALKAGSTQTRAVLEAVGDGEAVRAGGTPHASGDPALAAAGIAPLPARVSAAPRAAPGEAAPLAARQVLAAWPRGPPAA